MSLATMGGKGGAVDANGATSLGTTVRSSASKGSSHDSIAAWQPRRGDTTETIRRGIGEVVRARLRDDAGIDDKIRKLQQRIVLNGDDMLDRYLVTEQYVGILLADAGIDSAAVKPVARDIVRKQNAGRKSENIRMIKTMLARSFAYLTVLLLGLVSAWRYWPESELIEGCVFFAGFFAAVVSFFGFSLMVMVTLVKLADD